MTEEEKTEEQTEEVVEETTEEVVEDEQDESLMELWNQVVAPKEEEDAPEGDSEPVEDSGDSDEVEPEAGEPELPEYVQHVEGEVNLADTDEVDAINYWGGGDKVEWTKKYNDMTDHQKEVFKKHQSGHDKMQESSKEAPKQDFSEVKMDLPRLLAGDRDTMQKYGLSQEEEQKQSEAPKVSVDDKLREFAEAVENGDKAVIMKAMGDLLVDTKKEAFGVASKAKGEALEDFKRAQLEEGRSSWLADIRSDTQRLAESEGSAFTKYHQEILNLLNLTDQGIPNPLTGKYTQTVEEAYDFAKRMDTGGKRLAVAQTPAEVTPPAGASSGTEPQLTEQDYAGDTKSFMEKAYSLAQRNSNL